MEPKEKMFDRISVEKSTKQYAPNPEWLHASLEGPKSVARRFCTDCGLSEEIDAELFNRFVTTAGAELGSDMPQDVYVETDGCDCCHKDNATFKIKQIESH